MVAVYCLEIHKVYVVRSSLHFCTFWYIAKHFSIRRRSYPTIKILVAYHRRNFRGIVYAVYFYQIFTLYSSFIFIYYCHLKELKETSFSVTHDLLSYRTRNLFSLTLQ